MICPQKSLISITAILFWKFSEMFYVMQTAKITEWDKMEYLSFDVLMFGCAMFSGVLLFLIVLLD